MVEINMWAPSVLALIVGLVIGVFGALSKKSGKRKTLFWFAFPLASIGVIAMLMGASLPVGLQFLNTPLWTGFGKTATIGGTTITYSTTPSSGISSTSQCPYQPTATYSAKDKFSSTIISGGTAYYKSNGQPATTTAITNINKGTQYVYWYSNATTFVKPKVLTADCGANDVVADAWQNATVTITIYDAVGNRDVTNGAGTTNITFGANAQANVKVTYQGTAKKSAMPFGGLMVVEYNSTISDVTCTGSVLKSGNPSNFHLTFSPSATTHTSKVFEVGPEIDDGTGTPQYIQCQFTNGATSDTGATTFFRFIGANYYLTNAGDIVVDTEKTANQDNTRVGLGTRSQSMQWQ
jgi:hypothetical protein